VRDVAALIARTCLELPEVSERLSHGAPTYFIRLKKTFVSVMVDGHHDLDFAHMVCAAGPGVQAPLVAERPDVFFVPAYVGGRGWVGVRLDTGIADDEVADLCEDAYRIVAPVTLVRRLEADRAP
jgi:hypothetical protein